ncbi:MAG: hypothetical protein ACFFA6_10075, partial [Promethearchaeota archaeon]
VKSMKLPSLKILRSERAKFSLIDSLSMKKPKRISEKKILEFREQTICLMCEREVEGFIKIFICPQCEALYCERCTQKMIDMSNMCWICNEQIDESISIKYDKSKSRNTISNN